MMGSSIFLSTPSARRATKLLISDGHSESISIHALREEGDGFRAGSCNHQPISIHALREEGDLLQRWGGVRRMGNFYPRPPRGGRQRSAD